MIYLESKVSKEVPNDKLPVRPLAIHKQLDKRMSGLSEAKRFISTRMALHLKRAMDIAAKRTVLDKPQTILLLGASGSGKTFLMENAAAISKLPFVSVSAAGLTEEGYMGTGLSGVLHGLMKKYPNKNFAQYGICFLDEWDKRVQHRNDRAGGFSQGVQNEALRMMEGTEVEIEIRYATTPNPRFDTKGLMFVFAGAFEGLDKFHKQKSSRTVAGFSPHDNAAFSPANDTALRDALVEYGMIPEFINRLSGILTLPTPTPDDMVELIRFKNGPLELCNSRLMGLGAELVADTRTTYALAKYACDSKTYARGIQLILQGISDQLVYEGVQGSIAIEPDDIKRAGMGKHLRLSTTAAPDVSDHPELLGPLGQTVFRRQDSELNEPSIFRQNEQNIQNDAGNLSTF
jgi:ATP-dependent protease Clp ATPase subunit